MKKIEAGEWNVGILCNGSLLEELAYYCALSDQLEMKPIRGKDHLWVERVHNIYAVYWKEENSWWALAVQVLQDNINVLGGYGHSEPFDYKEALKEWLG